MHIATPFRSILILALAATFIPVKSDGQEYVAPTLPAQTGRSPGVKVKLIGQSGSVKIYALIFSAGDEVLSGLTEFALNYGVKTAHFTGIGDARTSKFGWYDKSKKLFLVNRLDTFAEITSLVGDIAMIGNNPAVHAHINLATQDGIVHGGHLLEAFVEPTLEVIVTVDPMELDKRLDPEYGLNVIDPDLKIKNERTSLFK
jgi:predicted DNA-binding protein with PD1-like motif